MRMCQKLSTLLAILAVTFSALAAEPPAPLSDEAVQNLVKDLGAEDFARREAAEKALAAAGAKVQKQLEGALQSNDQQVKTTVAKLLNRIRLNSLGPVNYLDVIPKQSMMAIHVKNLADTLAHSEETAFGKLALSQNLEGLRDEFKKLTDSKPEQKKRFLEWANRFRGQFAAALWDFNPMAPDGIKAGVVIEITDENPAAVYKQFVEETHIVDNAQASQYRDIDTLEGPFGQGCFALVGRHLIAASTIGVMQTLIDSLNAPANGMNTNSDFTQLKPALGEKPEVIFVMDMQAYMKQILALAPMAGMQEMLDSVGTSKLKLVAMSCASSGDSFEDRIVSLCDGTVEAIQAVQPPAGVQPVNALAHAPTNALLAGAFYVDGSKMQNVITEYMAGLKKLLEVAKQQGAGVEGAEPAEMLAAFEERAGVKSSELVANIKGEVAVWLTLGNLMAGQAPAEVGMLITCGDAAKANALSDGIKKMLNTINPAAAGAVKEIPYKTHTVYQLDFAALGNPKAAAVASPSWSIEGNCIYLSSTSVALQKALNNLDGKAPGLLTQPEFVKALGSLKPEERANSFYYADARSLLTTGVTIGLPLLQMQVKNPDINRVLAALPPAPTLFKDIPPVLAATSSQGPVSTVVIRSPLPPFGTLVGAGLVAGLAPMAGRSMQAGGDEEAAPEAAPAPAPAPAPGGK